MKSTYDYNGFASELERYLRPYERQLHKLGFAFHSKLVGPGMGARIIFVNKDLTLLITNDRSQFFISVSDPRQRRQEIELLILVSLFRIAENPTVDRKKALLLGGDHRDPLPVFFAHMAAVSRAMAPRNYLKTSRRTAALLRERSRLISPHIRKRPHARDAN